MNQDVRVIHGDCLKILPTLEAGSVDAIVTDPPFGTEVTEWDQSIDRTIIAECLRISRGYSVFFYSNTRLYHLLGIIKSLGFDAWTMVWHKANSVGFERRFAPQWMPIVCAYKGQPPFWGKDLCYSPIKVQGHGHPTPKPLGVTSWLVERACPRDGLVLDPFAGSGTTGVAALKTGRRAILIEKEERYIPIIQRQIRDAETPLLSGL